MVSGIDHEKHVKTDVAGQAGCAGGFVERSSQMRQKAVIAGNARLCHVQRRGNRPAWDIILLLCLDQRHRTVAAQRVRFISEHRRLSRHSQHKS
jgi:hypothetical protein